MSAMLFQAMLQENVNYVLAMAQRDVEELSGSSTNEVEEEQAKEAARALNDSWYLLEESPNLYFCLKSAVPLLERILQLRQSKEVRNVLSEAKKAIRSAERRIKREV